MHFKAVIRLGDAHKLPFSLASGRNFRLLCWDARTCSVRIEGGRLSSIARTSDCGPCPLKPKCCPKAPERKIPRSIYEDARDAARALVDTQAFEQSRCDRKRILRLGRLRLRGP